MIEPEYIQANRRVYDSLADDYAQRAEADRPRDVQVVQPTIDYLTSTFAPPIDILDLGCGNGINMSMFHEGGLIPHGIDISERMLNVAKANCPSAHLYLGNFLDYPFRSEQVAGIFAKASLHLFPKHHAEGCLLKCFDILRPRGMLYVATTHSDVSAEGYIAKTDYPGRLERYRKLWTRDELTESITKAGFGIFNVTSNFEPSGKLWINVWATKP